jgi:hypothetical protein
MNDQNHSGTLVPEDLWPAIRSFEGWLKKNGSASHDPYDLWGTALGLKVRSIYYRKGKLGIPLVAPFLLLEIVCPSLRSLFVEKQRFATADAQLALAFLNLYRITQNAGYLQKAVALAEDLLKISIPGYSGHCWGYPFDWQNCTDLWRRNTPLITATPYCFEVFAQLYDVTGDRSHLEVAASIARFVSNDLKDLPTGPDSAAGSYSPLDTKQVVNATAYRAFVLFDAASRFQEASYAEKARRNLNFILQSQRPDGSWLYSMNNPAEAFIDNFHTAFVLKNLYKIYQILVDRGTTAFLPLDEPEGRARHSVRAVGEPPNAAGTLPLSPREERAGRELERGEAHQQNISPQQSSSLFGESELKLARTVRDSICKGWAYYRQALFAPDGTPKSFAIEPRLQLAKLEVYNVAEAITLGSLLSNEVQGAYDLAGILTRRAITKYQLPAGYFITRTYFGGLRHTTPFLRWPQAQMFYALTNFLVACRKRHDKVPPAPGAKVPKCTVK